MKRHVRVALPLCAVVVLFAGSIAHGAGTTKPPELAMFVSTPGEMFSRFVFSSSNSDASATLSHPPYAVLKGRMLPGTRVAMVVADTWSRERDGTFGAALYRVEAGRAPVVLASQVVHATRPLVTAEGRLFIERGDYGTEPTAEQAHAGELRTDKLRVDEINPVTGEARTVLRFDGYTTHLAGFFGGELILYRVSFLHADLVAVNADSGAVRVLVPELPPFARDFSVDARHARLVFTEAQAGEVIALELHSGERTVLATDPTNPPFAPFAWPDGRVAWNDAGHFFVGGNEVDAFEGGTSLVRAVSKDGRWIAIDRTHPSELPDLFVVSAELGVVMRFPIPQGIRADVIGLVSEAKR